MKKNLFKILLAIFVFTFGVVVYANEGSDSELGETAGAETVVVGDVRTGAIYRVDISWDDLTFDWDYDGWVPASVCKLADREADDFEEKFNDGKLFEDQNCSQVTYQNDPDEYYYELVERDGVEFTVVDYSFNGQIVPSIEWNYVGDYEDYTDVMFFVQNEMCVPVWTDSFYNLVREHGVFYEDSACSIVTEDKGFDNSGYEVNQYYAMARIYEELEIGTAVPDSARRGNAGSGGCATISFGDRVCILNSDDEFIYDFKVSLATSGTPEVLPTSGDPIGTITVRIKGAE